MQAHRPALIWLALVATAALAPAAAETRAPREFPATVVTALPGAGGRVEAAVLIGHSGQIYEPDGSGQWARKHPGGIARDVIGAVRGPGEVIYAIGDADPIFEHVGGVWSARPLPNRGRAHVSGSGGAPAVALGRQIYVLKGPRWERQATARGAVSALWASSSSRVYVALSKGELMRVDGNAWTAIKSPLPAGDPVIAMAGAAGKDLYGVSRAGSIIRISASAATPVRMPAELTGFVPHASGTDSKGTVLWAGVVPATTAEPGAPAGPAGGRPVLVRADKGALTLVEELWELAEGDRFSVVQGGAKGALLIATRRGAVRMRGAEGGWSEGHVSGILPERAADPRSAPARTR